MSRSAWLIVFAAISFNLAIKLDIRPAAKTSPSNANAATSPENRKLSSPKPIGRPTFVSPHATPIALHGTGLFVVNTPSDSVDVIDTESRELTHRIAVGVDPVSLALRPDGKELWVSNHISDSVSVIDLEASSPTFLAVVATIQEFNARTKATQFDEPVGIAFANNQKAYVALSSENAIAVIDVKDRRVVKRLSINAQDPRAIRVQGNRLYVLPFESNNQTQLSGGGDEFDGDLVTFNAWEHSITVNNVLSLGHVVDIVKHPDVPDRDLFVFDTESDELVEVVDTLGTLLYGMTVASNGQVYVAQTDARNDVNGRSGTKQHGLEELENRAFLNQIVRVGFDGDEAQPPTFFDLEPLAPSHPAPGEALATPFAIQISDDHSTLIATAAGSDKLFTVDAESGKVLGRTNVGSVPRGITLVHNDDGQLTTAWVFNAVANSVSQVDVTDPTSPQVLTTVALEDPTHPAVKRGRIAFNTAAASSTGTFSCASCHPDGHTDQLLWVLKTPVVTGGNQIMPRSTMPIRGLLDTAPFHWDGIPGDPYGGNNSANIHGSVEPNSDANEPASSARNLIDGGLAATMSLDGAETVNDEGKPGRLSAAERDDMARFLMSVPYPPAPRRAYDNVVSDRAQEGFKLFHIEGDFQGGSEANVCGDCHRMPYWVSTNTPGTGMDAPTWRGAYDRWLILPQGRLNIIEFDFFRDIAERGIPERNLWQFSWGGRRRFDPVWDMVLEGSTGFSGSFARQVTLNSRTSHKPETHTLVSALEKAAEEEVVLLEVVGTLIESNRGETIRLQYDPQYQTGSYVETKNDRRSFTSDELRQLATDGKLVATLTAHHGATSAIEYAQPAIWTRGPIEQQRGRQEFPILYPDHQSMTLSGHRVVDGSSVVIDGHRSVGAVTSESDTVTINLPSLPAPGFHLLQIQSPNGLLSNDFIFYIANDKESAARLDDELRRSRIDPRAALARAATAGNLARVKQLVRDNDRINTRQPDGGSTPLASAVLYGHLDVVNYLLEQGAKPSVTNEDGNAPLHIAAFLCRDDIVDTLVQHGASLTQKNRSGDTPIDSVAGEWTSDIEGIYRFLQNTLRVELDIEQIKEARPVLAERMKKMQQANVD